MDQLRPTRPELSGDLQGAKEVGQREGKGKGRISTKEVQENEKELDEDMNLKKEEDIVEENMKPRNNEEKIENVNPMKPN